MLISDMTPTQLAEITGQLNEGIGVINYEYSLSLSLSDIDMTRLCGSVSGEISASSRMGAHLYTAEHRYNQSVDDAVVKAILSAISRTGGYISYNSLAELLDI